MPRTTRRLGLLAAPLLAAAALVPAHAQQPPRPVVLPVPAGGAPLPPGAGGPAAPAVRTDNGRFTLPEQRDAKGQLQAILDYLGRTTVPWDVVTGTAQRLLDAPSDSFYRVKDAKGDETGTVVSVKAKVNQLLAALPKDGRQFYEQEFGPAAAALLKTAVEAGGERTALETVSHRYFHTKAGAQATLLLANADLAGGRTAQAAYGYGRLLERPQEGDPLPTRVLFRAAVAFKRTGGAKEAALAADLLERAVKGSPRDGLVVGRQALSPEELRAEFDRAVQAVAVADRYATGRYGNDSRSGIGDAGTPFLDPAFVSPLVNAGDGQTGDGSDTVRQMVADGIKKAEAPKKEVVVSGFFPVTTSELVIFRTYDGLCAVAAKAGPGRAAGALVWRNGAGPYGGGAGAQTLYGRTEAKSPEEYWGYWGQNSPRVLFENAALGSVSHDGARAYYLDDLAVPPPPQVQNPNMGFQPQGMLAVRDDAVSRRAGYNRLVAVDVATGKTAWWLGGPDGKPLTEAEEAASTSSQQLTEGSYFLGPPVTVDGKVYALYEKRGRVRLGCFDPDKIAIGPAGVEEPAYLWSQVLGDATTSVRTEPYRRIQAAYLAHADGVMVCPTNSGAVVAVDINARSLLWARYYGTPPDPKQLAVEQPGMPPGVVIRRNGRLIQGQLSSPVSAERWRAAAPIITAGKVLVTAHDSDLLQCLDVKTGEPVWSTPREPDDLYVGGVINGNVVVVGKTTVRAYAVGGAGKGAQKLAWAAVPVGAPAGHGAAGKDGLYYLPVTGSPDQPDRPAPQVWAIDAATGQVKAKTAFRRKLDPATDPRVALGNLVFHDGLLFSQTPLELAAFPLMEPKRREMAERLKANPRDPDGLVTRGELSLEAGAVREAVADFKAAQKEIALAGPREKADPLSDITRRLDHKLYSAYAELARADFAAVEPDLAEYEKLCDLRAESDDPGETRRLLDESFQRRSLFWQLVARGREKQGRAGDAFDAYRKFAAHGDGRQLVTIDGEPNGQTRPDVWARGRLEALVRTAADPAALAARVDAEWASLKDSTDLPRLRAFAELYGAHFAAGRAAGLALADALAASGTADDAQEARDVLTRAAATAEDPADAARAVERHALLLRKRESDEEAVGLYARLGTTYAAVAVRDGKTGGDLFAEVVADRRLLPYLEPGAAGPSAAYKVDVVSSQQGRGVTQAFTLSPTGELAPAYRRLHLALKQTPDESWALEVTDRVTGEARARFPNLGGDGRARAGQGGQTGPAAARLAVADGHRVLLTLDHMVYCLDLAAPRKAWEMNLLGKSMIAPEGNPDLTPDGGLEFKYAGGWSFTLGRAVVLRPTYACLLTRDGLKCVDPATGRDLWVRTNVSPQAQVFGDDRYVFLVDKNSTRVLRAVDGTPVENVPDFSVQYNNTTAKVGLVGRGILLAAPGEPKVIRLFDPLTGADVWKKQYPAGSGALLLKTVDPKLTGVVLADGSFQLLNAADGTVVVAGRIDADRAAEYLGAKAGAGQPVALVDSERVYLVLARAEVKRAGGGRQFVNNGLPFLRALAVDGPIFAFDKATGKRAWYNAEALADQRLILERFDDLPVFVAFAGAGDPNGQGQSRLVILDKRTGYLRHNFAYPQGIDFQSVTADPRTRAIEFQRYDLSVKIGPADAPPP